jgi:hypothetical protein
LMSLAQYLSGAPDDLSDTGHPLFVRLSDRAAESNSLSCIARGLFNPLVSEEPYRNVSRTAALLTFV